MAPAASTSPTATGTGPGAELLGASSASTAALGGTAGLGAAAVLAFLAVCVGR
ncbi:hypothetical protein [Streptomyces finlayi]|uniref:hypothetical protein n=1 Tax=Streptomyces finlayi TaxID=67296 RepID=UPI0021560BC9|nr:hypothetical protein [Streptomyces finlayi]